MVAQDVQVGLPATEEATVMLQKTFKEIEGLDLGYPGWERDFKAACETFRQGREQKFEKIIRKLRDKQRVYDEYKAFTRLNALASLDLSYPGSDDDKQRVEQWHLMHPSAEETDHIFYDKLQGLRNKDKLFFGDRSHPNIKALDCLDLNYPGWEADYQTAITAHCTNPILSFADTLHTLTHKQKRHEKDRSHWRLLELDKLRLTYPGWEADLAEVEVWHLHNADSPENDALYAEVLEGIRDQQQIYMGWNHYDDDEESTASSHTSDETWRRQIDFYKFDLPVPANQQERDPQEETMPQDNNEVREEIKPDSKKSNVQLEADEIRKYYDSIEQSLQEHQGKVKKIIDSHENPQPSTPAVPSNGLPPRPKGVLSDKHSKGSSSSLEPSVKHSKGISSPPATPSSQKQQKQRKQQHPTHDSKTAGHGSPPPKQVKFGKCEVCYSRDKTHVFTPCGHLCACAACSNKAMETTATCPICRAPAEDSYRVFLT